MTYLTDSIKLSYARAAPNRWTFTIQPIWALVWRVRTPKQPTGAYLMAVTLLRGRPRGALSDFDKALIRHQLEHGTTVAEAARVAGHHVSTVYYFARTRGLLDPQRKKHLWTKQEDTYIESAVDQGQSYFRISQKLHYPTDIIRHRAYELGCTAQARNYSVARLASMFGVSSKIIKRWITLKALVAANNGTRHLKHYIVSEDAIYEFLEDEQWWYLWDAPQIVDGTLRAYAAEIREGKGWLTTTQAGHALGYTREGLRPYIYRGLCRAVMRTPHRGQRVFAIREDWIEDARQRMRDGGPPWWGTDQLDTPIWLMGGLRRSA